MQFGTSKPSTWEGRQRGASAQFSSLYWDHQSQLLSPVTGPISGAEVSEAPVRTFPASYLRLAGTGARRPRRATARGVEQKLTSVQERSDEEGAHAAGGQQVHPCESLWSNVGTVGLWGLTEPLG